MLEKIEKLITTNEVENHKLATHLMDVQMNKDNVIAVICLIRMHEAKKNEGDVVTSFLEVPSTKDVILGLLKTYDTRPVSNTESDDLNSYGPKDMFELSLNCLRSDDNLNHAHAYYRDYVEGLYNDAKRNLADEKLINDSFSV